MNKYLRVALLTLAVLTSFLSVRALSDSPKSYEVIKGLPPMSTFTNDNAENKHEPLVRIKLNNAPHCSGFVIDKRYVVTAAHCLEGHLNQKMTINPANKPQLATEGVVAGYFTRLDYGIIMGDFSEYNALKINVIGPTITAPWDPNAVIACGFAGGQRIATCTQFVLRGQYGFMFFGSGYFYPAMSGGPVIDLSTREAVGVIVGVGDQGEAIVTSLVGLYGVFNIEPPIKE